MCRSCSSQGGVVKHLKLCCLAGPLRGRSTDRMAAVMACQPNPLPAHHIFLFLCTAAIKLCRFAARGRRTTRAQGRERLSPLPVRREVAGQPRSISFSSFRAFRAFLLVFLRPFALYGSLTAFLLPQLVYVQARRLAASERGAAAAHDASRGHAIAAPSSPTPCLSSFHVFSLACNRL